MLFITSISAGLAILALAADVDAVMGSSPPAQQQRSTLAISRSNLALTRSTRTSTSPTSTPTSAASTATGNWYQPKVGTSFLWSLDVAIPNNPRSDNGLKLSGDVYGIDMTGTTKEQIAIYHKQGKKVVCYFSAGSWEPWRDDAAKFDKACYCNRSSKCKMDGWNEWCDFGWLSNTCTVLNS